MYDIQFIQLIPVDQNLHLNIGHGKFGIYNETTAALPSQP